MSGRAGNHTNSLKDETGSKVGSTTCDAMVTLTSYNSTGSATRTAADDGGNGERRLRAVAYRTVFRPIHVERCTLGLRDGLICCRIGSNRFEPYCSVTERIGSPGLGCTGQSMDG